MPWVAVAIIFYFLGILTSNFFIPKTNIEVDPVNKLYSQPIEDIAPDIVSPANPTEVDPGLRHVYYLQLGTFKNSYFAVQLANKLKKRGYSVLVKPLKIGSQSFSVVEIGPFNQYVQIKKHRQLLSENFPDLGKMMIKKRIKP